MLIVIRGVSKVLRWRQVRLEQNINASDKGVGCGRGGCDKNGAWPARGWLLFAYKRYVWRIPLSSRLTSHTLDDTKHPWLIMPAWHNGRADNNCRRRRKTRANWWDAWRWQNLWGFSYFFSFFDGASRHAALIKYSALLKKIIRRNWINSLAPSLPDVIFCISAILFAYFVVFLFFLV